MNANFTYRFEHILANTGKIQDVSISGVDKQSWSLREPNTGIGIGGAK